MQATGALHADESWHVMAPEQVLDRLGCGSEGLTDEQAAERRARYGANRLASSKRQSPVLRFIRQFHNVLLYVMMGAALITAILGQWVDALAACHGDPRRPAGRYRRR